MKVMPNTQYKYEPLLLRRAPNHCEAIQLDINELKQSAQYELILFASATRYPLWRCIKSGAYIGGQYHAMMNQASLLHVFKVFTQEAQRLGYHDEMKHGIERAKNPFPETLFERIPKTCWAYAYELGSREVRFKRRGLEIVSKELINHE
ncbi:hypothetical protein [Vibrio sp. TRT 29B02]|uniref:hypothetical protein n=1 Tax=Vibrio sp. TRT 29B02 TaxID=3418508 RepID=UPI003CEA7F64